jgi:type IV secretory pathway VirB4 component
MKPNNAEIPFAFDDPGRMVVLNPHDERYANALVSGKWGAGKSVLVPRYLANARGFVINSEEDQ